MRVSYVLCSRSLSFRPLPRLPDSSVATFRQLAFEAEVPYLLPRGTFSSLPAIQSWFLHPSSAGHKSTAINEPALQPYASTLLTTELMTADGHFQRHPAPLGIFVAWALSTTADQERKQQSIAISGKQSQSRLTIAQASLSGLPTALREQLPTPELVQSSGHGDVYETSLWMGMAPTVTPLHRDPNPNLLVQLAGKKQIRLLHPVLGSAVWRDEAAATGVREGGEEIMMGERRKNLEGRVWNEETEDVELDGLEGADSNITRQNQDENTKEEQEQYTGYKAEIAVGDALFIPKGWWHAVHGVGEGITASVCASRSISLSLPCQRSILKHQTLPEAAVKLWPEINNSRS